MLLSCAPATLLKSPDKSFVLDENNSIIFGKDEVILDGQPVDYKGTSYLVAKKIVHHIGRYISDEDIIKNKWKAGEYAFPVTYDKDGYFAVVLPPGKYYFVEFDYVGVLPDIDNFGVRTYMPISGDVYNPCLLTFDAIPNNAVYIGTIKHRFHTIEKNLFYTKVAYRFDISSNIESAKKWIIESARNLENCIVEGITTKTPLQN